MTGQPNLAALWALRSARGLRETADTTQGMIEAGVATPGPNDLEAIAQLRREAERVERLGRALLRRGISPTWTPAEGQQVLEVIEALEALLDERSDDVSDFGARVREAVRASMREAKDCLSRLFKRLADQRYHLEPRRLLTVVRMVENPELGRPTGSRAPNTALLCGGEGLQIIT